MKSSPASAESDDAPRGQSRRARRAPRGRGFTLIEAVAGLALLAALLTAMLVVKSRVVRQSRATERRRAAAAAADELLSAWWPNSRAFPRAATGAAPAGFVWRTRTVPSAAAESLGGQVVRLELFERGDSAGNAEATVEIVLPATAR